MSWEDYSGIYSNFVYTINQLRFSSIVSRRILHDYPKNVPDEIMSPVLERILFLIHKEGLRRGLTTEEKLLADGIDISQEVPLSEELLPLIGPFLNIGLDGKKLGKIDFERLILYQEIIMNYSLVEGFVLDSIRAVCNKCPDILKKEKQMTYKEIIESGTWEKIIENLVEKYAYDLGYGGIEEKLENIEKEYHIDIIEYEDSLKKINVIRNAIVHNGAKINSDYITIMDEPNLVIGNEMTLDTQIINGLLNDLNQNMDNLYREISIKFFNKESFFKKSSHDYM